MNRSDCDEFDCRLNGWIDRNESDWSTIWNDEHVKQCPRCRGSVRIWQELDPLLASRRESNRPKRQWISPAKRRWGYGWSTVAAAVLVIGSISAPQWERPKKTTMTNRSPVQQPVMKSAASVENNHPITSPVIALVSSSSWMTQLPMPEMVDRQWMDRTTPAMTGLRSGIEPISRTFRTVARLFVGQSV